MAACTLCGYRVPVGVAVLSECPVCGEPCGASDGRVDADVESGEGIEHAAGDGVSRGTSPLKTQAWMGGDSDSARAFPSSCLNPELQSLLQLVPEEQNRKKRAQDAVRAAGGALIPSCSDEGQSESDVVYIRPRIDPGMRALKGRYNTQPRVAKAASMSVLDRLAHPLMGYDSREALAPKARRRRQESVERLLRKTLAGGKANCADRPPWLLSRSNNSVELSRACVKGARSRRCNSGCSITSAVSRPHLATSVDAVHHQQRGGVSVGPLPQERGREHDEHAKEPASCETIGNAIEARSSAKETKRDSAEDTKRDSAKDFPFFHLRASERRRAKPSLRRKRVATMRSVNGWVRHADPASTRREVSLDRRINTLRRGGKRASNSQAKVNASHPGKHSRRYGSRASNGAFLTELGSSGTPFVETRRGHRGQGDELDHSGGDQATVRGGNRRSSGRAKKGKPFRVGGRDLSEGNEADRNAAGGDGRYGSAEMGGRAQQRSGTTLDRGQGWGARTVPVGAPQRQQQERWLGGTRGVLGGSGATEQAQSFVEQGSTSPTPELAERDEHSENLDARDAAAAAAAAAAVDVGGQAPSDPREALDTARVWGGEDGAFTREGGSRGNFVVEGTDAHEADVAMAPAWDNSRSRSTPTLDALSGARLAWDLDEPAPTGHSRSAWQLLRGVEADVPSQMTMLLQSFENKVAARVPTPFAHDPPARNRRPTSVIVDGNQQQQQQQQQRAVSTPLSDKQRQRDRHRHRRPLSRGETPPSELPLEGGFIRRQPASSGWVHRQSLPSLLTDRAGPQSSSSKPSTPTTARAGGVSARQRGRKSRPSSKDSTTTTRMQRLDGSYVTVGDAWDGRRGTGRRESGGRVAAKGSHGLLGVAAAPPIVPGMLQTEGAVVRAVSRGGRRGTSNGFISSNGNVLSNGNMLSNGKMASNGNISANGNILSAAVPRPLLYVGSGSGFKMRS